MISLFTENARIDERNISKSWLRDTTFSRPRSTLRVHIAPAKERRTHGSACCRQSEKEEEHQDHGKDYHDGQSLRCGQLLKHFLCTRIGICRLGFLYRFEQQGTHGSAVSSKDQLQRCGDRKNHERNHSCHRSDARTHAARDLYLRIVTVIKHDAERSASKHPEKIRTEWHQPSEAKQKPGNAGRTDRVRPIYRPRSRQRRRTS